MIPQTATKIREQIAQFSRNFRVGFLSPAVDLVWR